MALFTLIARESDGLPLSASIENEENCYLSTNFQKKAKEIVRKFSPLSPRRCSIEDSNIIFHYLISNGICYLGVFECNYSKRAAFSYLYDLENSFSEIHPDALTTPKRPYFYIEFSTTIQKVKKTYQDSRNTSKSQFVRLNDDLQDVHRIMFESIDGVLQRGELISILGEKVSHLASQSSNYKRHSTDINARQTLVLGSVILVSIVLLFMFYMLVW
ncbi:hypothetical protein LOD99_5657 [Oopsacas minuta]|uniref:Uncharacterized protein n=1 Tax=Oopsacas minuta TaxID=111878 RepID=A0AAV7JRU6_9METZ|nr:hypothetical protein LOD99_5657 [Oopsacas minuta]